jgi:hypothetical protein
MSTAQCFRCGHVSPFAAESCIICGAELTAAQQHASLSATADYRKRIPATPIGPFTFTSAFGNTFTVFTKNFWLITKLVFVLFAPFEIFKAISFGRADHNWENMMGATFLGLICQALIAPSLIYALHTVIRTGVAPGVHESYRWGLSRLPKFCVAVVITWVMIGCGLVLLVIPGLILMAALMLVYPIAALEKGGPIEILKRSCILTRGHRWNIFLLCIVLWIVNKIVSLPVQTAATYFQPQGTWVWPLAVATAIATDVLNETGTVLALVLYLGILATRNVRRMGAY